MLIAESCGDRSSLRSFSLLLLVMPFNLILRFEEPKAELLVLEE
jgi:hypothetical protein